MSLFSTGRWKIGTVEYSSRQEAEQVAAEKARL